MWDETNGMLIRPAFTFPAQLRCPWSLGQTGYWSDLSDGGALKLRLADGTDRLVAEPGPDAASFEARLLAVAPLPNCAYANAVPATLTANANGALANIDGVAPELGDVILVAGQATQTQNGLYICLSLGSASAPWMLARIIDMDSSADFVQGYITAIQAGTTFANARVAYTAASNPTIGTTNLTYAVVSEHAQAAEQISASGALNPAIRTSILSVSGTKAYALAAGTKIGQRKTIFCRAATSTPVGVLTPASPNNYATLTFSNANGSAELEWNGSSWDLLAAISVTVA